MADVVDLTLDDDDTPSTGAGAAEVEEVAPASRANQRRRNVAEMEDAVEMDDDDIVFEGMTGQARMLAHAWAFFLDRPAVVRRVSAPSKIAQQPIQFAPDGARRGRWRQQRAEGARQGRAGSRCPPPRLALQND